tara:strand:- start:1682 stop:1837 length:156 start_codon:yes stop_codon:yes gene_type:complete
MNYIKSLISAIFMFRFTIGGDAPKKVEEDLYSAPEGGACFYDPATGRRECE